MSVTDPISNLAVTLANAARVNKKAVEMPSSKFKLQILKLLEKKKIIGKVTKGKKEDKDILLVDINTNYKTYKRISKPGKRVYVRVGNIPTKPHSTFILSTPQGIMTDNEAIKSKVGGEMIMEIC